MMRQQQQQDDYCWNNNINNNNIINRRNNNNKWAVDEDDQNPHPIQIQELDDQLPSPQELMPLNQSLITPDLALAFNIHPQTQSQSQSAADPLDDQAARTLKRPRLVWTPQLHKRFVDAVAHLGIKNAVPKTIMQLMSVDGLTRENVASHLQKYRLYLKRMQGPHHIGSTSAGDAAMDRLFASSPVPPQFLRSNSDHFIPPPMPPHLQHHHHHQQFRHFGNHFEHPFIRQQQQQQHILRGGAPNTNATGVGSALQPVYVEDLDSPRDNASNNKKILTLFPTGC